MGRIERWSSYTLALVIAACGGGDSRPDARPLIDGSPPDAATPSVAHYVPPAPGNGGAWGTVPYPSDLFLDSDGMLTLTSLPVGPNAQQPFVNMLAEGLHSMDGAGVWSSVYFPIDGDVDPSTLADHIALVNLDDNLAEIPLDFTWRDDISEIVAVPKQGTILLEETRYGAYVTSDVTSAEGVPLVAGDLFAEAADLGTTPSDAAVAAAQENIRPLLEALDSPTRSKVITATVFTTEDVTRDTVAMRDIVAASPPPITVTDVFDEPSELDFIFGPQDADAVPGYTRGAFRNQPHSHVAVLLHGMITLPNFLSDTVGVDGFLSYDGDGKPVLKGTEQVKYSLSLPVGTDFQNLPVVIYVPGINRPRIDMLVQADTAAKNGQALFAIDLPYHGDRATEAVDVQNQMTGENTPDGFGDYVGLSSATSLFHLSESGGIPGYHPQAMRENLRRAAIELCSVIAFLTAGGNSTDPLSDALGQPVSFRTDTVALITESLGGLISGITLAVEPRLGAAAFTSPAAGFPFPSLMHSPAYSGLFMNAITIPFDIYDRVVLGDPTKGARFEPIVMLYDSVIERGEAAAYGPHVLDGSLRGGSVPSLLLTESYADETVPNESCEQYAGALGVKRLQMGNEASLPLPPQRYVPLDVVAAPVSGNVGGGTATAAIAVFHPASHVIIRYKDDFYEFEHEFPPFVELDEPVPIDPNPIAEVHAMWSRLVTDLFAGGGAPTLIDPYAK